MKSSELRKVKTPSEVIAAHEALEILNSESDDAAGYMQKVCRYLEPVLQEARELDVRAKVERRYQL